MRFYKVIVDYGDDDETMEGSFSDVNAALTTADDNIACDVDELLDNEKDPYIFAHQHAPDRLDRHGKLQLACPDGRIITVLAEDIEKSPTQTVQTGAEPAEEWPTMG